MSGVTPLGGNIQAVASVCSLVLRRSLLLLPILLVACARGGDGGTVAAPDRTTTTTTTTATTVPTPAALTATVDWTARTITVDGALPVEVAFCEGDAPLLCVTDGDTHLGVIELVSFPGAVDDFDAWAASFYESMAADRVAGCDPSYVLDGDDPVAAPVAGGDGVRYGFTGSAGGRTVERVLGYATNDGDTLRLLVANGLLDDGCLSREAELPLDVLDELEPVLAAIAAGSSF